jgi:hypothetical protein
MFFRLGTEPGFGVGKKVTVEVEGAAVVFSKRA